MSVSIVIPNYNGENLLKRNLPKVIESVSDFKNGEIEIIVADDCSTDKSLVEIQNVKGKSQPDSIGIKFKIIVNEKNLGFSSTINKGVEKSSGEIIILLNTDVTPEKDFLIPLLRHFKDPKIFAVGCMDKSLENGKVILRGRGIGKWQKGFLMHGRGEVDKTNTLWVSGGSGAFRKSIWDKLSGFDPLYNPFYWEDIDLSYRALKSGYKVYFEKESIVTHEHEKGAIQKTYSRFIVKTIAYRNQFIFVWKNVTDLGLQFSHFLFLPYHFANALLRMDWAFFVGFFKAFFLLPKIIKSSFKAQKLFVQKDSKVIKNFS